MIPAERYDGLDRDILQKCIEVYEVSIAARPEIWTRNIRNWEYSDTDWLNPRQEKETNNEQVS